MRKGQIGLNRRRAGGQLDHRLDGLVGFAFRELLLGLGNRLVGLDVGSRHAGGEGSRGRQYEHSAEFVRFHFHKKPRKERSKARECTRQHKADDSACPAIHAPKSIWGEKRNSFARLVSGFNT